MLDLLPYVQNNLLERSSDEEYMAAVESGDMATAQKMVDEAAKAAGYTIGTVYHGTNVEFNEFKSSADKGIYLTDDEQTASDYADLVVRYGGNKRIVRGFARIERDGWGRMNKPDMVGKRVSEQHSVLMREGYDGYSVQGMTVVFSPSQIKSADPVTHDDSGHVIPLSQRFNQSSNDIRY